MINQKSVHRYCKEDPSKIENYDKAIADDDQIWDCHHRTEIWWNCTAKELIENECYYNRKACELIFLTHEEHARLHMTVNHPFRGKHHSDETRKKLSEANKGITSAFKGKIHSPESRVKMSLAHKGKVPWNKGRSASEDLRCRLSESHKNISEETRQKMREAAKLREERKRKMKSSISENALKGDISDGC